MTIFNVFGLWRNTSASSALHLISKKKSHETNQLPYNVSDSVRQHPQCFQSIGKMMVLSRILSDFLRRISKESDFMPGDFYDPKPLRTKKFFSMLIEFHDFVCHNSSRLLDIESDAITKKETNDRLMEDIAKKMEIIRQLRIKNENIRIQEEEMLKRIAEVKDEILEAQGCKNDLKRQYDDTKIAISACESDIQASELKIVENKEVAEKLASQIIQPIEREELEERENFLARIRTENSEKRKNLAKLKQTLDIFISCF
ncbi:hypothetical protein SK128_012379 [Halocaridina rubra]|uniref:Kinetochore protein Nuf2 N-terminal domain-containing protein n=1 Tax=Halocaridina rubra TaxID=373956 RepID=A0AAN8X1M6_HALRR